MTCACLGCAIPLPLTYEEVPLTVLGAETDDTETGLCRDEYRSGDMPQRIVAALLKEPGRRLAIAICPVFCASRLDCLQEDDGGKRFRCQELVSAACKRRPEPANMCRRSDGRRWATTRVDPRPANSFGSASRNRFVPVRCFCMKARKWQILYGSKSLPQESASDLFK